MRQCKNVPGEEQMKTIIYRFWQCTWGVLQTAAGFSVFLANIKKRHFCYRGAVVTEWDKKAGLSLGMFVFVDGRRMSRTAAGSLVREEHLPDCKTKGESGSELLAHEYGHTVQSLVLGPLYLIVIGIPSFLWFAAAPFVKYRRKNGISYFSFYTERWADRWGGKTAEKDRKQTESGNRR